MRIFADCNMAMEICGIAVTEKFTELLSELEDCNDYKQKQKVIEMNKTIDGMNEEEFRSIFTIEINRVNSELILICVPCLLKAASVKEEDEETQKEVEIALLALGNIYKKNEFMSEELYLKEMKEIIQHHQEYHDLTRLAYQSAWGFLIERLYNDGTLQIIIVNELHFVREAARELEELSKCVDCERKEEGGGEKVRKEVDVIERWLMVIISFFFECVLPNVKFVELISSVGSVFRVAKDNYGGICYLCICSLRTAARNRAVKIEDLLESEAVDVALEEIAQSRVFDKQTSDLLEFFKSLCERLKGRIAKKEEKDKKKELKRKVHEKMEEEGYEDFENIDDFFVYC
ncbi:uncharacterized protein MONOS_4956 [Monocercomonoides exilis]|uniref:uncharacterized protein n=1 Tax=Monocercomonoides exilis TaxID=2049356 RepID=UPI003559CB93|nr:hypothetical protein MONOS_4956 [Monocercomonoides exilis]|eukprot:MONOS_4956.1-p1 / transcript=MONOS_4956.1 / gene=MONOS_4956 / organism=Monocercomonoides_exilis_PA203 / gene_product=unspecified product / transcript_product=unspecified product / location=Mono_scaffold00139:16426-17882(-) / protein_length=346 / sequence_SO=supercontig / SO=protein_coding / is_pseudo=false